MKILLINPYQITRFPQPLGLDMTVAVLEENGYPVRILDSSVLRLTEHSILGDIRKEKPDVIGIKAITPTIDSAINNSFACAFDGLSR